MAATFVTMTEEILKLLVYYFLSNNHWRNYTKTIIRLGLSEYYWIFTSPSANNSQIFTSDLCDTKDRNI